MVMAMSFFHAVYKYWINKSFTYYRILLKLMAVELRYDLGRLAQGCEQILFAVRLRCHQKVDI